MKIRYQEKWVLRHNYVTKFAFSRKLMTMLVFLEILKKKYIKDWRNDSNLYFQLFMYLLFIYLQTFQNMTWVVLAKSQLLRFKATFGSKICREDRNLKLRSLKGLTFLTVML